MMELESVGMMKIPIWETKWSKPPTNYHFLWFVETIIPLINDCLSITFWGPQFPIRLVGLADEILSDFAGSDLTHV